ncbi:MAG: serine/threonine protein kinase [Xanthomonadales bacterium]|nr:serine/threonine protein kinase [Xanthomonadales bacterium]
MSRIARLQALFHQAADLDPAARAAFLDQVGADQPELRAELEALLASDQDDDGATLAARVVPVAEALVAGVGHGAPGQQVGGYRLLREIGSGGMGTVFLAERDDREFRHQVAIKLVRGFPTSEVLERFRRERELLATLRHPNIARLFDGGTTTAGQPWLAMEYVEGEPLDAWIARHHPPLRERLRLFQALCSAVQHAHQQLIVHRDLKPANVLVRADGSPVLLDFGIGKLLDGGAEAAEQTRLQAMTPAYASPEQLRGEPATTLSDVFGLGLVLFELLAGVPLRKQQGDTTRLAPSRVAATGQDWLRADARLLRGDLDNIVRKALREEPQRRYASAAAMAADIEAWFAGRPVSAAPDAWHYRMRKFVARHPFAVGATLASIVLLAALSVQLALQRDRALAAQAQARAEAEGANQAAGFLVDLFKLAAPETTRGDALTVRDLVGQARDQLETRDFPRPEVKARLQVALGDINTSLGLPGPSIELLEAAVANARAADGRGDPRVLVAALRHLARAYEMAGRDGEAVPLAQEALDRGRVVFAEGDPELGHVLQILGVALEGTGDPAAAALRFEEARALFAAAGDSHRAELAAALHNLGWLESRHGDPGRATEILEQSLAIKREVNTLVHPSTFNTLQVLASSAARAGDHAAAAQRLTELLAAQRQLLGEPSVRVAQTLNELASAHQDGGDFATAEAHYREALAQRQALAPDGSVDEAVVLNNLASLLEDGGRLPEAEQMSRRALAMRIAHGAQPLAIARNQHNLARILFASGRPAAARQYAQAAAQVRATLPDTHGERLDTEVLLARLDLAGGATEAAVQRIAALSDVTLPALGRVRLDQALAELAHARGDRDAARSFWDRAEHGLAALLPPGHPRLASLARARTAAGY